MMPSANSDNCSNAPPLNRLSSWKTPCESTELMHLCTFGYETPGDGSVAPTRYTAMINRVNRILRRRSGVARAERKALSTRDLLGVTGLAPVIGLAGLRPAGTLSGPQGWQARNASGDTPPEACSRL